MATDYRALIGRKYREPFGCFELVRQILQDRGLQIPDYAAQVTEERKAAALRELIVAHCYEVTDPRESDVILLRWAGQPAHIGVMVDQTDFIHSLEGIGAHIESVTSSRWRNRIDGYWRVRD